MYGKKWRKKCVCKSKLFDSGNYFNSNEFCSTKTKVTKSRKDRQIDIMWSLYLMRMYIFLKRSFLMFVCAHCYYHFITQN